MEAYQDAVNYYQAALNAIAGRNARVQELPELLEGLGDRHHLCQPPPLSGSAGRLTRRCWRSFDDVYLVNEFEVVSGGNLALFAHLAPFDPRPGAAVQRTAA
jgi:hypothetical protein